jgi:hypothetical protein
VFCAVEGMVPALADVGMPLGGAPRAITLDRPVTIIVCDVPAETYAAEQLEPKLSDLDWVSAAGAAHHAVIDALSDAGATVVPFRLFTLFSSDDKAVETLGGSRPALMRAFDRVRGKQEWVLRIGKSDPSKAASDSGQTTTDRSSGTNFLQAKADAKRESAARAVRVKEDAAAAYEALEQLSDAAKMRPVDAAGSLLLDAAFLVPPDRVEALRETLTRRAERLLRDGCPVSLTGPWPPYSFAFVDAPNG